MSIAAHKVVVAGVDALAEKSLGAAKKAIARDVAPLARRMRGAKVSGDDAGDYKRMLRALSAATLREMKTDAMTEALADAATQAALIGQAAAEPDAKPSAISRQPSATATKARPRRDM